VRAHAPARFVPAAAAIGVALALNDVVSAQQVAADSAPLRVDVTGSNIRRAELETALPLQIITRDDLERGGVQTAEELLYRISANQSYGSFNEAQGVGSTWPGFTAASLRGLGAQRTLVLLDGRRLAPYALSGGYGVDLSGIPASAIERVEVLKDGASAIYGTDAIGGVINFILRTDYRGAEVNASTFVTQHGGGDNRRVNATVGAGDLTTDRYNVFVTVDYFEQDALRTSERDSTKTSYLPELGLDRTSNAAFPSNINNQPGGFRGRFNPSIPYPAGATPASCAPPYSFPTVTAPYACRFDIASVGDAMPETDKTHVFGRAAAQLTPEHRLFADFAYYHGRFVQHLTPTPANAQLPTTSPFYPAAFVATLPGGDPTRPVPLQYRVIELGPRVDETFADQWNGTVGLQGTVAGWDYVVAGNYNTNRQTDNFVSGWVSASAFLPILRSGVIDPFGYNSDTVVQQMRATQITGQANDNRASNYGADLKVTGAPWKLPGGPVSFAFGAEARRESLQQSNAPFLESGDVLGGAGANPSLPTAHRTVWSLLGEANVPLARTLELDVALRYDHYSDFGSTTNPKVTLRWQPASWIVLRGSGGTGFRVPTLSDLFQPRALLDVGSGFVDTVRCPVTGAPSDCDFEGFGRFGGNPALQPEKSRQVNAGVVLEPVKSFSTSIDYYRVRIDNVIDGVPLDTITGDMVQWASYIERKPPDAQYPTLPGPIVSFVQYATNIGTYTTSGIDFDVRWRPEATAVGRFTLTLTGTYVLSYGHTGYESAAVPPGVGTRGPDGAIARYRQYAQLDWSYGPWGATIANTYQSAYSEVDLFTCEIPVNEVGCTGRRRVGSYTLWDLQARYEGIRNLRLAAGIRNVLDTPPPVSNQSLYFQSGIDPSYADARGRTFYATLRYAFR
jgi:iron complex outermembrane receptor protein